MIAVNVASRRLSCSAQLSESGLTGLATPAMHNIKSALMDQIRTYQQQLHDLKMRLGDREGELDTLRYGWWQPLLTSHLMKIVVPYVFVKKSLLLSRV